MEKPDDRPEVIALLKAIKKALPDLKKVLEECQDHWGEEDKVYRFYHQSYKVFRLQDLTVQIVDALKSLAPKGLVNTWTRMIEEKTGEPAPPLNPVFLQIVGEGTGKEFKMRDNDNWLEVTRPILESYFHAKYFLEMIVEYGEELERPPACLPSGWATVLYLFHLR